MKTLAPAVKVGITVAFAAALGYWAFAMLAKGTWTSNPEDEFQLYAYFRDATLLVEKSRVQVAGLNIGNITKRELSVDATREDLVREKRFAKITMVLVEPVKIYENAVVSKRAASLLGEYYLEIDPGTPQTVLPDGSIRENRLLKSGDEIVRVGEAVTASMVMEQVSDALPELKGLIQDMRSFAQGPLRSIGDNVDQTVKENREAIRELVANLERISSDIRGLTADSKGDIREIVDNVRTVSEQLRLAVEGDGRGGISPDGGVDEKGKAFSERFRDTIDKLNTSVTKLDHSLANIEGVTDDLRDGKGTAGRLLKDERLINDIEDTVSSAGDFIQQAVGLQTIVGVRSEFNFEVGRIKTYLTVEIKPRPDKYYLIELVDDPRGRRSVETVITRSDDPSKPLLTREERVRLSDEFRISFQFAKRISFATFRFGIKESTGGIGVDFNLWDDRISINTDIFDVQTNTFPRVKVAAWRFFSKLYVVGGVDDAINNRPTDGTSGGRDFFVGGQFRFNDEDLKQLLLFGGSALSSAN